MLPRTISISAKRDLLVSNGAGVDECQSRGMKPFVQVTWLLMGH